MTKFAHMMPRLTVTHGMYATHATSTALVAAGESAPNDWDCGVIFALTASAQNASEQDARKSTDSVQAHELDAVASALYQEGELFAMS